MNIPQAVYISFGLTQKRGSELFAELCVYAAQHCVCSNPCACLKEPKLINMLLTSWPGSTLSVPEEQYLWFMAGRISPELVSHMHSSPDVNLGDTQEAIEYVKNVVNEGATDMNRFFQSILN
jgi:hypothetical protein